MPAARSSCSVEAAIDNAFILDMAMGGSTNTVLHTLALAREAGLDYDMARLDALSKRTPCICKVSRRAPTCISKTFTRWAASRRF